MTAERLAAKRWGMLEMAGLPKLPIVLVTPLFSAPTGSASGVHPEVPVMPRNRIATP